MTTESGHTCRGWRAAQYAEYDSVQMLAGHGTVSPATCTGEENVSFFPLFSMPRQIVQQGKTNTAMRERGNRPAMTHIEPSRVTVDM